MNLAITKHVFRKTKISLFPSDLSSTYVPSASYPICAKDQHHFQSATCLQRKMIDSGGLYNTSRRQRSHWTIPPLMIGANNGSIAQTNKRINNLHCFLWLACILPARSTTNGKRYFSPARKSYTTCNRVTPLYIVTLV